MIKNTPPSSGFTLVEVALALGICSIVALGASQLLKTSTNPKIGKNIEFNEDIDALAKTINNRLICGDSFQNLSLNSDVPSLKRNGKEFFKKNQMLSSKSQLTSMTLVESSVWSPVADGFGAASLKVQIDKDGKTITKFFPVSVQLDQNKKVIGCSQNLELASVDDDIYKKVCSDVVGGNIIGTKCYWTKPVRVEVIFIPAPPPPTVVYVAPPAGEACYGPICDAYLTILGRYPDAGGKAFWEETMGNSSLAFVASQIAISDEALGIAHGPDFYANYEADVNRRGMTLQEAVKQCGVDKSC